MKTLFDLIALALGIIATLTIGVFCMFALGTVSQHGQKQIEKMREIERKKVIYTQRQSEMLKSWESLKNLGITVKIGE